MSFLIDPDPEDQSERSRIVDGVEYMSVAEYMRQLDSKYYPVVEELRQRSGRDGTYIMLGKMAAEEGQRQGVKPVHLYHPDHTFVNGWPAKVLRSAWFNFHRRYRGSVRWLPRDPEPEPEPEPEPVPAKGFFWMDDRWVKLSHELTTTLRDNTSEQRLLRRQSASAAMFAIEKEYER